MTISVIDLSRITYTHTEAFTRNAKGSYIQRPYIVIEDGLSTYHLLGRNVMWSLLDSLFPTDPLPRMVVEDDLFAPTIHTPSMLALLLDFTAEAVCDNEVDYLVLSHNEDGWVDNVENLDRFNLSSEIEIAGMALSELSGKEVIYRPFIFKDSKGTHLRPSASAKIKDSTIEVIDLGGRWYWRITSHDGDGIPIGVIMPVSIDKKDRNILVTTVKGLIEKAVIYSIRLSDSPPILLSDYLTAEYDRLLYSRNRGLSI